MIFLKLFYEFFKIGLFTFGGGYAMIPLVEETVLKYGWLTPSQFESFIGVCESTPGPIAINMATYVGSIQGRLTDMGVIGSVIGSITATLGVVMPSFLIILLIASIFKNFTENKHFKAFVSGVKPVVIALLISTGAVFMIKSFGYSPEKLSFRADLVSIIIFASLLIIYFGYGKTAKKKLSTIPLIVISAVLGIAVSLIFEAVK